MNLKDIISRLDINADWVGLREYKENTTYHVIRDKNPLSNGTSIDHGIMVEGLVNGQFGYCATHDISYDSINKAAESAYNQAINASKYSIFSLQSSI